MISGTSSSSNAASQIEHSSAAGSSGPPHDEEGRIEVTPETELHRGLLLINLPLARASELDLLPLDDASDIVRHIKPLACAFDHPRVSRHLTPRPGRVEPAG